LGAAALACGDDEPAIPGDPEVDAAAPEGGSKQTEPDDAGAPDTGTNDAGPKDAGADADADVRLPGVIDDLTAVADTHEKVTLTWTAPAPLADAGGAISSYELKYATTPITTEAEFLAATPAAFVPAATGAPQTYTVSGLAKATAYYFAARATDDLGTFGPVSNDASVTTKARAKLLISEVAPANTAAEGGDFVELVAAEAGSAAELEIRYPAFEVLHKLGALDVQVGDRIVLHFSGLPGPAGFAQEDATNDKASSSAANASPAAFDVYLARTDLPAAGASIIVSDGVTDLNEPVVRDVVPYSNWSDVVEDQTDFENMLSGVIQGWNQGEWLETPDGGEICDFLRVTVNASGDVAPECGDPPALLGPGSSIQRSGVVDTNTRADFTIAPQTRGQ